MNLCTKSLVVGLKRLALRINTFNPTWRGKPHDHTIQTINHWGLYLNNNLLCFWKLEARTHGYGSIRRNTFLNTELYFNTLESWSQKATCSQITHRRPLAVPRPGGGSSPERSSNWRAPNPLPARRSALQAPREFFLCSLPSPSLRAAAGWTPSGTSNWLGLSPVVHTVSGRCVNLYYSLLTFEAFDDIKR